MNNDKLDAIQLTIAHIGNLILTAMMLIKFKYGMFL